MADAIQNRVRQVIEDNAGLSVSVQALTGDDDLFSRGMSSHASVSVMVALEDEFGVEFPDSMLDRNVFASIDSLTDAVSQLVAGEPEPVRPAESS
jgi:acyl carrier protein